MFTFFTGYFNGQNMNEDILTKPATRDENTNTRPSGGLATMIT